MANVQTPHEKKPPVRNNNNNNHDASSSHRAVNIYCVLCRRTYLKHEAQEHMHGMLHHRELETVLGKGSFHECQACNESSMGLNEYAQHISTAQHKANLKSLMSKNVKPFPLTKTLDPETIYRILERNKTLKKEQKKAMKKKRKKIVKKSKQVNTGILKHMQETHHGGSNSAVVQNKENKVSSLQQPTHQREATVQNQSERLACVYGEPVGQTWHHPCFQDQFTPSSYELRYDNFSVRNQYSKVTPESFQADSLVRGPYDTPMAWPAFRQHDHYNKQYDHAIDFTSDHFPQNGAIIFDHSNEIMRSSQPQQEGSHCSAQPASANTPANTAPIQDTDVSAMLWQIRRALGVREPCRADREARRQKSDTGVRLADQAGNEKKQPAGDSVRNGTKKAALPVTSAATTSVKSSLVGRPTPVSQPGVCPSNIAPAKPEQTVKTQKATQHCEKSPVVASHPKGPSNIRERESQGALHSQASPSPSLGRITSSESSLNVSRKVRIARETIRSSTLFSLSGAKRKLSWREMYDEMRRKKLEKGKGMPRFGIELVKTRSDQETSSQAEDLPLSEGFHWESLPDVPSSALWAELPPPPQGSTDDDSHTETQSEIQMQEPLERPGAAQHSRSSETIKAVSVKVEPNLEDENGDLRDHSCAKKRQYEVVTNDDISDKEQRGKMKKTKSSQDQNQMDQLLAVSLREDELSHSLQDLDESLIKARNILQVTYTEVQRLLLLRQQCTAEVNSLRARRIEILQGMKGGYSGASDVAEKATTSSAWATAAIQPRLSPLPSSSAFPASSTQQPPPTNPTSSISQPNPAPFVLPTMPVMREICQPPPVSCNPDTPQVLLNQPLFPSDLLPPLLLSSPGLVASTTAVTSPKQLKTKCCTSANPSPESSARQTEPVTKKGLKDCVKTGRLVRDEVDGDSNGETGGHLRAAAEKPGSICLTEKDHNASAAALDNEGENETDDSIKVTEPSNLVVIDADESDKEETISNVPVHPEPPQKSVSVEFSSVSVQTGQKKDVARKVQPTLVPVKDASVPPECAEGLEDEEPSLGAFVNHTGPVLGLQVHEGLLYTCSADNTARAYSLMTKECQAVFKGHTSKVNCLLVSSLPNMPARLFTGSSDQTIRCYSIKSQKCLEQISLSDRVLCLHIAWNILFAGLASGSVACYELKTLKQLDVFDCHGPRGVSCLGTAQEGARRVLLVGSYDSTISVRDARSGLLLRSLEGHTKTVLCMKVVNDLVFSGSSDTSVHAHNIHTGELVRIYKGHGHAVTSIVILGKVMVTACLDKLVRVYELQSHDRLQVYGGHSDMVMCMAVHKSVIYTGCYDGSIQAVKLNLLKNYRCWWQNCSLIFGMAEHLTQHLVKDHTNPNQDWVKCRWRGCSSFFAHQQSVRQKLPEHMRSHAENDSEVRP